MPARLLASPVSMASGDYPSSLLFSNLEGADYREKMYAPHHRPEHVFQREPITLFLRPHSLSFFLRRWNGWCRCVPGMFENGAWREAGIGLGDDLESFDRCFFREIGRFRSVLKLFRDK